MLHDTNKHKHTASALASLMTQRTHLKDETIRRALHRILADMSTPSNATKAVTVTAMSSARTTNTELTMVAASGGGEQARNAHPYPHSPELSCSTTLCITAPSSARDLLTVIDDEEAKQRVMLLTKERRARERLALRHQCEECALEEQLLLTNHESNARQNLFRTALVTLEQWHSQWTDEEQATQQHTRHDAMLLLQVRHTTYLQQRCRLCDSESAQRTALVQCELLHFHECRLRRLSELGEALQREVLRRRHRQRLVGVRARTTEWLRARGQLYCDELSDRRALTQNWLWGWAVLVDEADVALGTVLRTSVMATWSSTDEEWVCAGAPSASVCTAATGDVLPAPAPASCCIADAPNIDNRVDEKNSMCATRSILDTGTLLGFDCDGKEMGETDSRCASNDAESPTNNTSCTHRYTEGNNADPYDSAAVYRCYRSAATATRELQLRAMLAHDEEDAFGRLYARFVTGARALRLRDARPYSGESCALANTTLRSPGPFCGTACLAERLRRVVAMEQNERQAIGRQSEHGTAALQACATHAHAAVAASDALYGRVCAVVAESLSQLWREEGSAWLSLMSAHVRGWQRCAQRIAVRALQLAESRCRYGSVGEEWQQRQGLFAHMRCERCAVDADGAVVALRQSEEAAWRLMCAVAATQRCVVDECERQQQQQQQQQRGREHHGSSVVAGHDGNDCGCGNAHRHRCSSSSSSSSRVKDGNSRCVGIGTHVHDTVHHPYVMSRKGRHCGNIRARGSVQHGKAMHDAACCALGQIERAERSVEETTEANAWYALSTAAVTSAESIARAALVRWWWTTCGGDEVEDVEVESAQGVHESIAKGDEDEVYAGDTTRRTMTMHAAQSHEPTPRPQQDDRSRSSSSISLYSPTVPDGSMYVSASLSTAHDSCLSSCRSPCTSTTTSPYSLTTTDSQIVAARQSQELCRRRSQERRESRARGQILSAMTAPPQPLCGATAYASRSWRRSNVLDDNNNDSSSRRSIATTACRTVGNDESGMRSQTGGSDNTRDNVSHQPRVPSANHRKERTIENESRNKQTNNNNNSSSSSNNTNNSESRACEPMQSCVNALCVSVADGDVPLSPRTALMRFLTTTTTTAATSAVTLPSALRHQLRSLLADLCWSREALALTERVQRAEWRRCVNKQPPPRRTRLGELWVCRVVISQPDNAGKSLGSDSNGQRATPASRHDAAINVGSDRNDDANSFSHFSHGEAVHDGQTPLNGSHNMGIHRDCDSSKHNCTEEKENDIGTMSNTKYSLIGWRVAGAAMYTPQSPLFVSAESKTRHVLTCTHMVNVASQWCDVCQPAGGEHAICWSQTGEELPCAAMAPRRCGCTVFYFLVCDAGQRVVASASWMPRHSLNTYGSPSCSEATQNEVPLETQGVCVPLDGAFGCLYLVYTPPLMERGEEEDEGGGCT